MPLNPRQYVRRLMLSAAFKRQGLSRIVMELQNSTSNSAHLVESEDDGSCCQTENGLDMQHQNGGVLFSVALFLSHAAR